MSTTLSQTANCPNCGKPLPASAPAGLCPACLLAQGMDTDLGGEPRSRFQPPPVEEIARLFPQLEILGLLGAGGMGAVYKARQPALDRLVALKVLPPQGAGGTDSGERFNREARALARLSHPNIVAVHEFGFARAGGLQPPSAAPATNAPDGDCKSPAQSPPETPNPKPEAAFPYFIMEFVDGANLRQLGRAARLSPREALQIIPQICDALQYAHDEGVVHRDIKPENVLVDRKGRVKIADFGLAKIFGPDGDALRLTAEGQVMGTPHYMAPEQVERPLAVDHRADIYSLGVVFYELLTGDLPLGKFAPPSRKVSVDVRLDDVVLRALENDPARRYQKVSEVKSQVETITTQRVTTGGSRREEPVIPPTPRLPASIVIVGCLFLYHGAEALWRTLNVTSAVSFSFNFSSLALPVGLGILRLRPIARLAALLLLLVVCCFNVFGTGVLWFGPEKVQSAMSFTMGGVFFEPGTARQLVFVIILGQLAAAGWSLWILTRPEVRALFVRRPIARPWLEWAVLAAVIAVSALAPMWHAANAALGAGGWLLLASGAAFAGWYWFTQSSSGYRREEAPVSLTPVVQQSAATTRPRGAKWVVFFATLAALSGFIGLAFIFGMTLVLNSLRDRTWSTGLLLAAIGALALWFSWRRARHAEPRSDLEEPGKATLRMAWTNFLLGSGMVLVHLAPRLLGRSPQALEAQLSATGLGIVGWLGLGMVSFGGLCLMKPRGGRRGFARSLAVMSCGLLVMAFVIFTAQGHAWYSGQQPRFIAWQLAWIVALGVLLGWSALAAARERKVGAGWRVLAVAGALAVVALAMFTAVMVGVGVFLRSFPAIREKVQWGEHAGFQLTLLSVTAAVMAWFAFEAWRWAAGKRALPGERLGPGLACLVAAWVVTTHHSMLLTSSSSSAAGSELQPGEVRLFQTHTSVSGSHGMSFSGSLAGLRPGWRLNAGWVMLDGSGAGPAKAGTMASNHFHYMFAFPTAFALRRPQPVPHPQPWLTPSRVWDLSPGKREAVITVTNSVGQTLACFVELLPDTTPTPLGNSAVAVQPVLARSPGSLTPPVNAAVSLTVAPRHVAAVGVFLRERDGLTPLPELSALQVTPAGEQVSREISWAAMSTESPAPNNSPSVRINMGVGGELSRRAEVALPESLAGCRLMPVGLGQGVLLAAGEVREWVLFNYESIVRSGGSPRGEIVARLVSQPLAADWRPDLIQPHFRRGTNWAQLTQSDPSRQNQFTKVTPASVPGPRAPRGQLTLLRWLDVSVHGNDELIAQGPAAVSGREMVLGRLRWPNGRVEESESAVRIHNTSFPISPVVGIHYAFPTNFPLALKEQAAAQLRSACHSNQPLTLLAGQWQPVFSITNAAGESVTGEMTFNPGAPSPKLGQAELEFPTNDPMQARASGAQVSLALRSEVPLGYQLLATAESPSSIRVSATVSRTYRSGKVFERVIWFLNRTQSPEIMANAAAQVRAFVTRDSLLLKLGERKEVFRFTNDRGETFAGALELIAAP